MTFESHTAAVVLNRPERIEVACDAYDLHLHNVRVIGDYENMLTDFVFLFFHITYY